jgi:HSP20 family protein
MDRLKQIRSEAGRSLVRIWEGLSGGWQDLIDQHRNSLSPSAQQAPRDASRRPAGRPQVVSPPDLVTVESWETAKSVILRVELPGMTRDVLDVAIHGRTLVIRDLRPEEHPRAAGRRHRKERAFGRCERKIALPPGADTRHAELTCADGVVTLILAKREEAPPRG